MNRVLKLNVNKLKPTHILRHILHTLYLDIEYIIEYILLGFLQNAEKALILQGI